MNHFDLMSLWKSSGSTDSFPLWHMKLLLKQTDERNNENARDDDEGDAE